MQKLDHDQGRDHIRDHLQVAHFLAQSGGNQVLLYLIEMALAENEDGSFDDEHIPDPPIGFKRPKFQSQLF